MAVKLKAFLILLAHTILSFVAMMAAGCALYTSLRPLLGRVRYQQLAQTPLIVVLLLTGVALGDGGFISGGLIVVLSLLGCFLPLGSAF